MLTNINDVIFQCLWRHSCQFQLQAISIVFLTCTCALHFEKDASTSAHSRVQLVGLAFIQNEHLQTLKVQHTYGVEKRISV